MKIYRRLSQFGSKLAIILQEPLRSTVPFIPSWVTWEKYFTARCAKPLRRRVPLQPTSQATICELLLYGSVARLLRTRCGTIAAHLTAVYHSCAGYSIVKILCPSTYKELGEAFCSPFFQKLCDYAQAEAYGSCLFCPLLIREWEKVFLKSDQKSLDSCTKHNQYVPIILPSTYRGMGEAFWYPISHNFHFNL